MLFVFLIFIAVTNAFDKCKRTFDNIDPDYIIVGGGAGGSVALNKCIKAGHTCVLIERGSDYIDPFAPIPSQNAVSFFTESSFYSVSVPLQNMYGKVIPFIEPNILGGSTTINAMLSTFTDIQNFYREINITGWSYEEMLPYYLSVTKSLNRPGFNGSIDVTNTPATEDNYLAFKAAVEQVFPNIPERMPDMNTASLTGNWSGYGPPETTIKTIQTPVGQVASRSSGYVSYVQPLRSHPNLRILTGATVERIVFQADNTKTKAVIVEYTNALGVRQKCELSPMKGLILSAGALRTPQILLRSGVGPAAELQALGIPVVKDNSYVGRDLDDHPSIAEQFIGSTQNSLYSANIEGHAYWNYQDNPSLINDWTLQIVGFMPTQTIPPGFKSSLTQLMNQKSRGSVKIQANGEPIIDLGYFNSDEDLYPAGMGYNKTVQVTQKLGYFPITPVSCPSFLPHCLDNTTAYYIAAFLQYGMAGYHFTGTCSLGKVVDPLTGKVYGFDNLYVMDASVLPKAPRGNTQISVYALAEKLAASVF